MEKFLTAIDWLEGIQDRLTVFVRGLKYEGGAGQYFPCREGRTQAGDAIKLGFSCLALKIHYILGLWETLSPVERSSWISYIQSFQFNDGVEISKGVARNAFIDSQELNFLKRHIPWSERLFHNLLYSNDLSSIDRVIIGETRQAIATLAEVGESPSRPYRGYPWEPGTLRPYLDRLPWAKPWSAGGQASALAVFYSTDAYRVLNQSDVLEIRHVLSVFFRSIADPGSGAYFRYRPPKYGQLVNGAMKVLTALDWLDEPIHYPQKLIDTCLHQMPIAEGCHVVDWVYVLYRCSKSMEYRKADIQSQCRQVLSEIRKYHNPDGGFSSRIGKSKSHYYGVRVSKGFPVSDIHGTLLMIWAIAMILEILGESDLGWRVIKP